MYDPTMLPYFYNIITEPTTNDKATTLKEGLRCHGELAITDSLTKKTWCVHLGDEGFIDDKAIVFKDKAGKLRVLIIDYIKLIELPIAHIKTI